MASLYSGEHIPGADGASNRQSTVGLFSRPNLGHAIRHYPDTAKADFTKTANDLVNQPIPIYNKLLSLSNLYKHTRGGTLRDVVLDHVEQNIRPLVFQLVAEEIAGISNLTFSGKQVLGRFKTLRDAFELTPAASYFYVSYSDKLSDFNEIYPISAIYLAAALSNTSRTRNLLSYKFCLNFLDRSATRYASEEDTGKFIEVAAAAKSGAKENENRSLLGNLHTATLEIFVARIIASPDARRDRDRKVIDTSETLKNFIPVARNSFGVTNPVWRRLSQQLRKEYGII